MRRIVSAAVMLWLALGINAAPAQELPEGTFASSVEDCAALELRKPSELGEDFDFEVLTKNALQGYAQRCDFANVAAKNGTSWVATALCDEAGYIYPDMFAIRKKDEGTLNVTRLTDLTPQGGYDSSAEAPNEETDSAGQGESGVGRGKEQPMQDRPEPLEDRSSAESYSTFFKCEDVKP